MSSPAWKDEPDVVGLWLVQEAGEPLEFACAYEYDESELGDPELKDGSRYYGPIERQGGEAVSNWRTLSYSEWLAVPRFVVWIEYRHVNEFNASKAGGEAVSVPFPHHSEPMVMRWSDLERDCITRYAAAVRKDERERCAKAVSAENVSGQMWRENNIYNRAIKDSVDAIRALKEPT